MYATCVVHPPTHSHTTATGIGYDAAVNLADDFTVYAGVRKEKDAEMLRAVGKPTLIPVILDVTSQHSVDVAFADITKDAAARGVPVWGLVNNAGIMTGSTVEHHGLEGMQQIFDVVRVLLTHPPIHSFTHPPTQTHTERMGRRPSHKRLSSHPPCQRRTAHSDQLGGWVCHDPAGCRLLFEQARP